MSYASELASLTRKRIDLIEIVADYCDNTYGNSPCTASGASGSECYNTFKSCQDTTNYGKTTKTYQFVNADLPLSIVNNYYGARPYIKQLGDLPTEIKETDTVIKRLKAEFYDEVDNDVTIDPYYATRSSIQGTFWKKWLARNPNYKGRLIKQYEGFEGLSTGDFQLKFVGKIENISINRGVVTVEATDLMKELSKIEYPLKTDITIVNALGKFHTANSETNMLALDAYDGDFCGRDDYQSWAGTITNGNGGAGTLAAGVYLVNAIYYDDDDRRIAQLSGNATVTGGGNGYISVSWTDPSFCNYVRIYVQDPSNDWYYVAEIDEAIQTATINSLPARGAPFSTAERIFEMTGTDPSDINDWTEIHTDMEIEISDASSLESEGYMKIDDEIIYFKCDGVTDVLYDIARAQYGTNSDWHDADAIVYIAFYYTTAQNPFTLLKDILDTAGITASYIDTNFTTLESAWSGINFKTLPIIKNKLSEIYFDLVNAVDCISWVGEDGKVKIKEHSDRSGTIPSLTDTENFIGDSISVDLNEESRYTRWLLYWNRFKADGSITDEDNYTNLTITIDAVAEGAKEYNDEIEDIQTSTWINTDNDTPADVTAHVNALLASRKNRTRDAQTIINAEIELKDTTIATGDLVYVSTSKIQNTDGTDYDTELFRVIKKEMMGNKAKLKMIRIIPVPSQELATQQDQFITTQQDAEIYIQG